MQHWGDGHNVVASQEDLEQAPLALLCFSLPPELVDLLLDYVKLLLLFTYRQLNHTEWRQSMSCIVLNAIFFQAVTAVTVSSPETMLRDHAT